MVGGDDKTDTIEVNLEIVDVVAANLINGVQQIILGWNQSKTQKKERIATFSALVVITPETTFNCLLDELKESSGNNKEKLYQLYMESKAKEKNEKKFKEFDEVFGI